MTLAETLGVESLHSHQQEAIDAIRKGQDCLCVSPTGSGKSLIYQAPAILGDGKVIVISPLIALMRDQTTKLINIKAMSYDSQMSAAEQKMFWQKLDSIDIIFVSPERLASGRFAKKVMETCKVSLVAVDEAHCIDQWGQSFRPEYGNIGTYLEEFAGVPKIALTATATKTVQKNIIDSLNLDDPLIIVKKCLKDNMQIETFQAETQAEKMQLLLHSVLATEGQGIVYCPTRKVVKEVFKVLTRGGVDALSYHGGLDAYQRSSTQKRYMNGHVKVLVATCAFGMGIDKQDIRFVFHYGIPASLEQYVQEIGRAGRDGSASKGYLFYHPQDKHIQKFVIQKAQPQLDEISEVHREIQSQLQTFGEVNIESVYENTELDVKKVTQILRILQSSGFSVSEDNSSLPKVSFEDFCIEYEHRLEIQLDRLDDVVSMVHGNIDVDEYFAR